MQSKNSLKVAVLFSAIGQYSIQILGFAMIMILARLLSPEEIGVYAVAGSITVLATELRSLGAVQYLVREKEIPEQKIKSVLGMTIIVSWGLGIILIVAAPFLSSFYNDPAIKILLWILSSTFFLGPFTSIPIALWQRNLQFQHIFIMMILGEIVTFSCSIILVLLDFSYYGIAIGTSLGVVAELIVALFLRPPGTTFIPNLSFYRDLVKFGFFTSSTNLFTRFAEGIPDLVIGKMRSMHDVGQFSRGFGAILFLNKLLVDAVSPVVLPHLSDVKHSGESVSEAYLKSVNLLLAFSWPVLAVASAASLPMINALFGDQWDEAVSVASILAVWGMLISVHSFAISAFIVSGAEKLMFAIGLIVVVVRLILVIMAASYGLDTIALAIIVSGIVEFSIKTLALKKTIDLNITGMFLVLLPNLFLAVICWLSIKVIDFVISFEDTNSWGSIGIIALIMPIIWMFMLRIMKHQAWYIVWDLLNKIILFPLRGR